MGAFDTESAQQRRQRQFLDAIEQAIHDINHEAIHGVVPMLDKATFMQMAKSVAQLRVKYIAAATASLASGAAPQPQQMTQLKVMREQFEEARAAFDAVKRALTRNYINVALNDKDL